MAKVYKDVQLSTEEIFLNQAPIAVQEEPLSTPLEEMPTAEQKQEFYEQGYIDGQQEGARQAAQEIEQLKQQLMTSLTAIPEAIAQNRLALNSEIADIVLLITQQFFVTQQKDSDALTQQINQVLNQLNNKHSVELCLHPQEIIALQQGALQLDAAHLNGLKIKGDESLNLGGYVIKTNHGVFDASIEKQIDKLKEVLIQLKQRGQHASLA